MYIFIFFFLLEYMMDKLVKETNTRNYKHKSGSNKRKLQSERELQAAKNNPNQTKLNFKTKILKCTNDYDIYQKKLDEEKKETLSLPDFQEISINLPPNNEIIEISNEQKTPILDDVFIAPCPKTTTQVKLAFLDQHPIHPESDNNDLPFQASRIYYRQTESGDKFLRKWLSYCLNNNRFYCSICMAFSLDRNSVWVHGTSYTVKRIYDKIKHHENNCRSHEFAVQTFTQITLRNRGDIVDMIDSSRRKIVANNREVVARVIDIIIFLAKQNLAFRGKRNESLYDIDIFNEFNGNNNFKNRGNFMELVKLISKYDPVLRLHIEHCTKKRLNTINKNTTQKTKGRGNLVTFLSKNMFIKIIDIMRNLIQNKISDEVNSAGFFSLEVDTTQDVSVSDQLCICLRYVNSNITYERILSIITLENSTGIVQSEVITKKLHDIGIKLHNLVSCSFDGAANMMGQYNGLKAHLQKYIPNAVFTHCQAHVLNLIIVDTTKCCLDAQNLFSLLQKTSVFIKGSFKRTTIWKNLLANKIGNEKLRRLQLIGDTRWNSKDTALQAIFHSINEEHHKRERFAILLEVLHTLGYDSTVNSDTSCEARDLLNKWSSFKILLTAFIFLKLFSLTTPVSKYLQTKGLDYLVAWTQIISFQNNLIEISNNDYFEVVITDVEQFIEATEQKILHLQNIEIEKDFPVRRTRRVKIMPGEKCTDEIAEFDENLKYKVQTFRTIMDKVLETVERRFTNKCNKNLLISLSLLSPGHNYFENLENRLKKYENSMDTIVEIAGLEKIKVLDELRSFASCYSNLVLNLKLNSQTNLENLHEISNNDDTGNRNIILIYHKYTYLIILNVSLIFIVFLSHSDSTDSNSTKHELASCKDNGYCIPCAFSILYEYNFHSSAYSNLYRVYKVALTLSCTQVCCERAFSKLKIIKNRLRSSMGQEMLESLMLISIESDLIPDKNIIMDKLGKSSNELSKLLIL